MSKLHFTTRHIKPTEVQRNWYLVDATNQTLGRMCAQIAHILRGKNKSYYTPHIDTGDFIVVTNCEKIVLTGKKMEDKVYIRHTGYPGGQREEKAKMLLMRKPQDLVEKAVKGMLPKNKLGAAMFKKLFVYAGETHPHQAQNPQLINFTEKK